MNKMKKILITLALGVGIFSLFFGASQALAADLGLEVIDESIGLSNTDPRETVGRIINIAMLALGTIALLIVLWGGFIWLTSNGESDKIDRAKQVLKNGVVGLVIILSAWGIATFVLNQLLGTSNGGNGGGSGSCQSGQFLSCGCGGRISCIGGSWGPCLGSDCSSGNVETSCDSSLSSGCQANASICADGYTCNTDTCACEAQGDLGDACSSDADTCSADDDLCSEYLSCDTESCQCVGAPVIKGMSPIGGFCSNDNDKACEDASDCGGAACDAITPNGASGNIISIFGKNFGDNADGQGKVTFLGNSQDGGDDAIAVFPQSLNPECGNNWSDTQIVVVVPPSARAGAISVTRGGDNTDTTDDERGPRLADFVVNSIDRPGLCKLNPESGDLSDDVSYYGLSLSGADAYFGDYEDNAKGLYSSFIDPLGFVGTAKVPNIKGGEVSSFVSTTEGGVNQYSNYLYFSKNYDSASDFYISSFEPRSGKAGQYVTIYGSGFGSVRGSSHVYFGETEADYRFPEQCLDSVWENNQIIVKVPEGIADGNYSLRISKGGEEVNADKLAVNRFRVDPSLDLLPSLCKVKPTTGQIGNPISLWGENFGNKGQAAAIVFSKNVATSSVVKEDGDADKLEIKVPQGAVTGPLLVRRDNLDSNSLNFAVGECESDGDCSNQVCCGENTYKAGRCADSLADCAIAAPASVFEWKFDTGLSGDEDDCDIMVGDECIKCSDFDQDRAACSVYAEACCFDAKQNLDPSDDACRSGNGTALTSDASNPDYGYCAYYDCQSDESGLCAASNPLKVGYFSTLDDCNDGCKLDSNKNYCSLFDGDVTSCQAASGCCFDQATSLCSKGTRLNESAFCAYYDCLPNTNQCNSIPAATGRFKGMISCQSACANNGSSIVGMSCQDDQKPSSCALGLCASPFACLADSGSQGSTGECGACCCDVSNEDSCNLPGTKNLSCLANQAPCSGENRGLCCGCSLDSDCGDAASVGCDSGACCRARPQVEEDSVSPANNQDNVCRNTVINVPFNQSLAFSSLDGNVLLLEERSAGDEACPSGTALGGINTARGSDSYIARVFYRVLAFVKDIFGQAVSADTSANFYCLVPASLASEGDGSKSAVSIQPIGVLAADTAYYAIIKGDAALDSNSGVLSSWGIGMNGRGYLPLNGSAYISGGSMTFNGQSFPNSYIMRFSTLPNQSDNNGICNIASVSVDPYSYLFQTTENHIDEDDSNWQADNFDNQNDGDKLFIAHAYSSSGEELHQVTGYAWDWSWNSPDGESLVKINVLAGAPGNYRLVRANQGISDGNTYVSATVSMARFKGESCESDSCSCSGPSCPENCCNYYLGGDSYRYSAPVYIFICDNPWPTVNNDGTWTPWKDNCDNSTGGACSGYGYAFYYCRDNGQGGSQDDLPAIINPAVITGTGNQLACTNNGNPCSELYAACGNDEDRDGNADGICVWNVLKESYFFRESLPSPVELLSASDRETGGAIELAWRSPADILYQTDASKLGTYKIYYQKQGDAAFSNKDVSPLSACTPANPKPGDYYQCQVSLTGLENDARYYFRISAVSAAKAESQLSAQLSVVPTDQQKPAVPIDFSVSIDASKLTFSWTANTDDTVSYRVYHGVAAGTYVEYFEATGKATNKMELDLAKLSSGDHYFAISARDDSGNESVRAAWPSKIVK